MLTQEQVTSAVRWLLSTLGGVAAGFFAAKGWFTVDQVTTVINSPAVLSIAVSVIMLIIGQFSRTQKGLVASAAAIPGTTVVTTPEIAAAVTSPDAVSSATVKVVSK